MAASRNRRTRKKQGLGIAGTFLILFLVALIVSGVGAWLIWEPFGPSTETFVEVIPGSPSAHVAQQLESAGVVRSQYAFDLLRWVKRGKLKAGEYRFDHPASVVEVYDRIARGDVFTIAVTVPEGASVFEVASRLDQAGIGTRQEFLDAQPRLTELVADLDPRAKTLEGYLFPDTYRFQRKATPLQIATAMVEAIQSGRRRNRVEGERARRGHIGFAGGAGDGHPIGTAACRQRLQKPAGKADAADDRSLRYLRPPRLKTAGGARYTQATSSTTLRTTPTFMPACPPAQLETRGGEALRAAMEPAQTNYLYFVAAGANPQGRSLFASTIEEHNQNVSGYRHAMKKAGGR